ncbi:hypothetical protein GQ44DRAFT_766261 [Phaeosphaeriaceae sp. PMI808]|nr:hypothetical protein GQ44DRAFT_766261 [Phaeosphaeriaceae sp. PMI808]
MSDEQNSRVQSLQERLQPLSPSGQIPGLEENEYFGSAAGEPGQYDLDLDSFVQDQDFFSPDNNNAHAGGGGVSGGLADFGFDVGGSSSSTGVGGVFDHAVGSDAFAFQHDGSGGVGHLGVGGGEEEGRVESVSSNATSPAATVEEVEDESRVGGGKRRKK